MLGVLAVVTMLGAVVAENILTRIRIASRDAEATTMTTLAGTLRSSIIRSKSLPASTNWAQAVASYLSLPINKVTTTAAGNTRLFLVDPDFHVGTNIALGLPYTQTRDGSVRPVNSRIAMVSSLATALPTIATTDRAAFSNIWNTLPNGVPADSSWLPAWANRGRDLRILRFDLGRLFHRVILENLDPNLPAPYSIETTNTLTAVPIGGRQDTWFIHSTAINFHSNDNTLQAREQVVEDVSYSYENGRWQRYLLYGRSDPSLSTVWFGQMVDRFLVAPLPPGMTNTYPSKQWIIDAMYTFLYDFGQWSIETPAFSGGAPWPHIPGYEQASAGASGLNGYSLDLISYY